MAALEECLKTKNRGNVIPKSAERGRKCSLSDVIMV